MTPVHILELILILVAAAVFLSRIAQRLRLPPVAALLVGGMVLALLPGSPAIDLDPNLILVLFLPPLLLAAALSTVWRDFRTELRPILILALGAVTFTTFIVGAATHLMIPSLPWAACFTLGAIVSPPDAVAAKVVLQQLKLPRRILTILEGESLINDASSLLLYRFAVAAALTGSFDVGQAAASFAWLTTAGVVTGLVTAWLAERIFRHLDDSASVTVLSFLTAYASYIGAERLHASGVLAVVACGLILGQRQSRILNARNRTEARIVWEVVVFVLEAFVFVLIGLSLRGVMSRMGDDGAAIRTALPLMLVVNGAVIVSRFVSVFSAAYAPGLNSFRRRPREPSPPPSVPFLISWAGIRGVVSLAPALALPTGFPGRDLILLTAFSVILVTVLLQGTTLGALIRLTGLSRLADPSNGTLDESSARLLVAEASLYALKESRISDDEATNHARLIDDYRSRISILDKTTSDASEPDHRKTFAAAMLAIKHGRAELIRLQRDGRIHDAVFREVEHDLDLEEVRIRRFFRL